MISEFQGEYRFLSNFYHSPIRWYRLIFPTVEHAYQASKTTSMIIQMRIARCGPPSEAKRMGRIAPMREDWDSMKLGVMEILVKAKFDPETHPTLVQQLLDTGDEILQEGNKWNDRYWGVCRGVGKNHLGNILMTVREYLRDDQ
jgi:ribA/ribD-fused uncharacterized protein